VLEEARVLAEAHGVEPTATSRSGLSAGAEIVECARELQADAVVLGTRVRRVGEHPFLGHSVEHVLEHGRGTTVIVVVLPDLHTVGTEPYADRQNR
jgi:nucleotide-binding universal stress UspA family protein